MRRILQLILLTGLAFPAYPQFVPEFTSNDGIYLFLDELANAGLIEINSAVKPYSKAFILFKLQQADANRGSLNNRQQKELAFHLRTYRPQQERTDSLAWTDRTNLFRKQKHLATSLQPFGLHYKDKLFQFSARPIYGITYYANENGSVRHTRGGLDFSGSIGGHWGIFASLYDNYQTQLLARPGYFTTEEGGAFKERTGGREGGDFSEMRAGISYGWKWGHVALVKDVFTWGNNYHGSNILSGRSPSFVRLELALHPARWLDFRYFHGWLVSEVIDSTRSYVVAGRYKEVFRQKYIAANMVTLRPWKKLNISVGNSIVYSDLGGVHPAYLIPLAFFKSIDHTLNHAIENQNSQMFLDISSRQIKNTHLYLSMFIDEFSVTRLKSKESHNFISWKGGIRLSNLPVRNIFLTAEFTQTTPITYKHDVPVITYESSRYNLGHYLGDNSREIYASLAFKPFTRLMVQLSFTRAEHGNDYEYLRNPGITELPMLTDMSWTSQTVEAALQFQLADHTSVFANFSSRDVRGADLDGQNAQYYLDKFTAPFFQGKTSTLSTGLRFGL